MNEERLNELISKYLAGEGSPGEEQELYAWTEKSESNRNTLDQYQQLWQMTELEDLSFEPDVEKAWGKIDQELKDNTTPGSGSDTIIRRMPLWSKAAAIALLLSVGYFLIQQWGSDHGQWVVHATGNQQLEIVLPDKTQITLNTNSHLRYLKAFEKRDVQLEGEAYFDVAKDEARPFTIISGGTQMTVLGTAFNLRAYPDEPTVELTMERGKVAFMQKDKPETSILLQANESAIYSKPKQELIKADQSDKNALSWKKQALYFSDTPLSEIVEDLERYFLVDIELAVPELGNCQFTGDYQNPELSQIITVLEIALGLEVQQQGDRFVLSGNGCD